MIPRCIQLHGKARSRLSRLRQEAEQAGAYRVARRLHAILLNSAGRTSGEVARILQSARSKVSEWLARYEEHGVTGLLEGHRSGRPGLLTESQRQNLADIVESGPVAYGLNTGVWTSPILSQVIREEFGVGYHPGHVRKLLQELGFSVQRPTTQLVQADPRKQNQWIRYTYPNLKKKPKPRGP